MLHRFATGLVAMLFFAPAGHADDWSLTTADFMSRQVQLKTLSPQGLGVVSADSKTPHDITLNDFVSIHRTTAQEPPSPPFTLILTNGDRYVGTPGAVVQEKLTWKNPTLGTVILPLGRLVSITRGLNLSPPAQPPKQDVITLSNGDTATGVFTDCSDQKVTLQTDSGSNVIPLETIRQITLASTGSIPVDTSHGYRLHLTDASILTAADVSLDTDQLAVTLPGTKAAKITIPLAKMQSIEQLNGPVNWLSSLIPTEEIQTPYLAGAMRWPARFDLAVDGSPLCIDGRVYDHGIGVHAYSRLTFALDPQWTVFRTQYAIDSHRDQPRKFANVTVRLLLDGQVVHEEKDFRQGTLSPVLTVDLKSAKTLTLECDYGPAGDTQARLDWLQPALLRQASPATMPASQPSVP